MNDVVTGRDAAHLIEEIVEDLAELVVLAEYAARKQHPPKAKAYKIEIDRTEMIVHVHEMTGRQILGLVNKDPEQWCLQMKLHGGQRVRIEPNQIVVFCAHHIERFETSPKRARAGEATRNDILGSDDVDYLNSLGLPWEVMVDDGKAQALVIRDFPLPGGANRAKADLMIRLPNTYPAAELDMFNLPRGVGRTDGRALDCLSDTAFGQTLWTQWSRHRLEGEPWRPGTDCVATHLALVEKVLLTDLG
jgi:hypothetical protein